MMNTGSSGAPMSPPAWANPSHSQPPPLSSQQQTMTQQQNVQQHEEDLFSPYSTLDEPVMETIMRDVHAVASKLKIVLQPLDRSAIMGYAGYAGVSQQAAPVVADESNGGAVAAEQSESAGGQEQQQASAGIAGLSENDRKVINQLKDWDLWGPLIVCLFLAVTLSFKAPTDQASLVFAAVFSAVWVGGTVVTINAQLLGGRISFFQSLCVLGYCIFPMALAAFLIGCLQILIHTWLWLDFIFVAVGFIWSTRVSSIFIGLYVKTERRFLALYPVFFFYTFLGWMILLF
jgi:hypothetical protein